MKTHTNTLKLVVIGVIGLSLAGCSTAPRYYITNTGVQQEPEPTTFIYQNVCPPVIYPAPVVTIQPVW